MNAEQVLSSFEALHSNALETMQTNFKHPEVVEFFVKAFLLSIASEPITAGPSSGEFYEFVSEDGAETLLTPPVSHSAKTTTTATVAAEAAGAFNGEFDEFDSEDDTETLVTPPVSVCVSHVQRFCVLTPFYEDYHCSNRGSYGCRPLQCRV